jgi:biotin carboxyl carrier protein
MPGLVKSVLVQVGQTVEAGEPLIILEAMKMENVLKAPVQVTVRQIKVAAGDKVDKNSIMMLFEN